MKTYKDLPEEIVNRVMSNVSFGFEDECWNWLMGTNQSGRPKYVIEKKLDGKRTTYLIMVQHLILEREGVEITSKIIDTTCGNPICCNPKHLQQRDFETRFWKNTVEDKESGCLLWQGDFHEVTGYGRITIDKKSKLVHRVAYEQVNGEIPEGLMVLHSPQCVSRLCINPVHLRVGTHDDNMRDMANSNVSKGERNANSILKETDVLEIKQEIRARMSTYQNIADKHGVSRQAIKDIALGRTWKWLE